MGRSGGAATGNDADKFATYYRDGDSGLDYAVNRYYLTGRFSTPDPDRGSATAAVSGSWNRYSYSQSDPVNRFDPQGLNLAGPECIGYDEDDYEYELFDCASESTGGAGGGGGGTPQVSTTIDWGDGEPDSTPWTNTTSSPPCEPAKQFGLGGGVLGGVSLSDGIGPNYSAGALASAGYGKFWSGRGGTNNGGFVTVGGFTAAKGSAGNYPPNNTPIPNFSIGSGAGVGGGVFVTNAGNTSMLGGAFTSVIASLPGGVAIEVDYSDGVGVLSLTYGRSVGLPAGLTVMQTNTIYTSGTPCP